ncbi:MAG: type I DNA topoisomerase [Oscillospiraceae bacterium]|nr:type I DNA topoisomerase [Oscillospiraceae bacterium]
MAKAKQSLVIVESPAKAKTIGKYLGDGFKVKASMGHLRDLPKKTMGVDIDHGFTPEYVPSEDRADIIRELKTAAKSSDLVYLATDPDREGEAISWHLKELLGLDDANSYRVTFNEITKKVIQESIQNPRRIDQDLVDSQQARRILDRIVGYKLSPLLWTKIRRGLSAGRVQSVATRMVVEREEEITAFKPEEYWHLDVTLDRIGKAGSFKARFHGDTEKKRELTSAAEVQVVVDAVKVAPFAIDAVKRRDQYRSPAPPFITSTLQQEASRKLGMTTRRTMSVAQQLYEGIEITGEGAVGLITYMRTDSLRISDEAKADAKRFIEGRYGKDYRPDTPRVFKGKNAAQDAHEAIRPSDVNLTPEDLKKDLSPEQYRLYRLIWSRFLASQMSDAIYDSVTIDAVSAGYVFRANHSAVKFAGFSAVYEEGKDEEKEEIGSPLPDLREGEEVRLANIAEEQKFTQPPARYTEASLVRAMEEKGIGRPSTYAPTISTIMDREYVVKEGKHLRPTSLGTVVTGLMKDKFGDIVDMTFTARMEESLDQIEEGKREWREVLGEFYQPFSKALDEAEQSLDGQRIRVPDELSDELCDKCGKQMVIKSGRFGRFLACPGYPECDFTKPIVIEMPGKCPKCDTRILKRTSKRGFPYYACEKGAACGFMTWDVPVAENCAGCGKTLFKLSGKGFRKPFCINETCEFFLPEDKRGYKKKPAEGENAEGGASAGDEKAAVKKPTAKKTATAKKTTAAKKPAAKKSTAKKTTAKKPAAKKSTTKKTGQ